LTTTKVRLGLRSRVVLLMLWTSSLGMCIGSWALRARAGLWGCVHGGGAWLHLGKAVSLHFGGATD
jgi:hypothetical protein